MKCGLRVTSLAVFLFILFPSLAFAQSAVIRNDTPTTLIGQNLKTGSSLAVDQYARLKVIVDSTAASPSTSAATFTVESATAAASVAATYTTVLTNTAQLKNCIFNNQTNQPVSFDNSTNAIISGLPAGAVYVADFGSNGRDVRSSIRLKYTGSAPTTGTVYLNCFS